MASSWLCVALGLSMAISIATGQTVEVNSKMRSFSSAIKGGVLTANMEKTLYEHSTNQPGVITEQWFTGSGVMDERARIRIYIDSDTEASLDFMVLMAHGIGFTEAIEKGYTPWSTRNFGHTADGGIYNTYRIPFSNNFKVTATHPVGGHFWYIIRGVENYPLRVGDLILPAHTRLHLYKTENVVLKPKDYITLANVSTTAGYLYQVTLAAESTDFNYLEACMRLKMDGSSNYTWLSSGTEDFFLSAYYFNRGVFHTDDSGLTHKAGPGMMSAYKFFHSDPLLFTTSVELIWRCGEDGACPSDWPPKANMEPMDFKPLLNTTNVTAYVWIYQYTL